MKVRVKTKVKTGKLKAAPVAVGSAANTAINDIADDLVRASSGAAPHDKGVLEKSWNKKVSSSPVRSTAEVSFSVHNKGFNYAIKMHEGSYNLGPGSRSKPGGQGMSGTHYSVGPKFLERPLMGEQKAYSNHFRTMIAAALEALD
jgi:hypothetical protein